MGLSEYLHSVNKLIGSRISVDDKVSPPIDYKTYLCLICASVKSVLEMKHGPFLPIHVLNQNLLMLLGLLSRGQELFILSHEYGHFLAGHLEDKYIWAPISSKILKNYLSKNESQFNGDKEDAFSVLSAIESYGSTSNLPTEIRAKLEKTLKMKAEEIEADEEGAFLALNAIKNTYKDPLSFSMMTAGIDASFSYLNLLERLISKEKDAQKYINLQLVSPSSHPAAIHRRNMWRNKYKDVFNKDTGHIAGGIEKIVEMTIEDILSNDYGSFEKLAKEAENIKL